MTITETADEVYASIPSAQQLFDSTKAGLDVVTDLAWSTAKAAGAVTVAAYLVEGLYGVATTTIGFGVTNAPILASAATSAAETVVEATPLLADAALAVLRAYPLTAIAVGGVALAATAFGARRFFFSDASPDAADERMATLRKEAAQDEKVWERAIC